MKSLDNSQDCITSCLTRRQFLGGCAACAAGISTIAALGGTALALDSSKAPALGGGGEKTKIRLVLAYPSPEEPIWPNIGYDFDGHNKEFVTKLRKACPAVEFLPSIVMSDADADKLVKNDSEVDGYLVYLSGCLWGRVPTIISSTEKPLVLVDHLFAGSGQFLVSYGRIRRQGAKIIPVSSSKMQDIADAVRCIECLKKLRNSKMLVVGREPDKNIEEQFGTKIIALEYAGMQQVYNNIEPEQANRQADKWIRKAQKVIEPTRKEIEKSAAMYLAMCDLMKKHNAQAIAINCLSGFYGGHLTAYPCMGFMQLNNDGYVGACEADQRSMITMLLGSYLLGRPGYISDPVIDTSKNQIIYAHCVAPTKVFGPAGSSNPYHIRSHSEDRKGACNRSLMPLGQMTTTIEFDAAKKQVIFHQGKTVENIDVDRACRNKLAVEVKGDVFKLLNLWDQWGWHRVTFFGDFKRQIYNVSSLLGFEVIEEA
jgi:hypothetical protein